MPTPTRVDRYRNVAAALTTLADHVDLYTPADGTDPDAPQFPLAAWLLVALEDLADLADTDVVTHRDRATFVTGLRNTWTVLSDAYDRRAAAV